MPLHGWMYLTHRKKGKASHIGPSEEQIQQEGLAVSQHPTRRASRRVSRTPHCCVTLKARWPEAGGCLLCQSNKAHLALFIPLQGQFAVCDLSKGNATWQELLTSEEYLGVSEDIGHSFRVYPFVIFRTDFPPSCFLCFNLCCRWGFIHQGQPIPPGPHPFDDFMAHSVIVSSGKGGGDHTREKCRQTRTFDGVMASNCCCSSTDKPHLRYKLNKEDKLPN